MAAVVTRRYRVLKQLALVAAAAGVAAAAVRRRSAGTGRAEADLWHEATSGPQAVSRPTAR
ncbi:DLW-39 family protein [Geodermatophilus sp. SYSU D00814]